MRTVGRRRVLFVLLILTAIGCKRSPFTTTINPAQPTILVICNPNPAGPDAVITVDVAIAGNTQEVRVFGLEMSFDSQMFEFQSVAAGGLTSDWAAVDGNEASPGILRIGGFVGGGSPIAANNAGSLAAIKLKVTGSNYGNGQQASLCIQQYTDDIASFQPTPACTTFTLRK